MASVVAFGQSPLSPVAQQQAIAQIEKSAQSIRTMKCDFTQVRTTSMMKKAVAAEGHMEFSKPSKLSWHYLKPHDCTFTIDGGRASMTQGNSTKAISGRRSHVFKRMADVIIGCIMGGNMSKAGYFKVAMYKQGNLVYANLTPLGKEIKKIYKTILLRFDQSLTTANRVELVEKNGDKTVITLHNIKINQ